MRSRVAALPAGNQAVQRSNVVFLEERGVNLIIRTINWAKIELI